MCLRMSLSKPTLLIDEDICRANIRRMSDKARQSNTTLIPHFKTHQSHAIGEWFREEGINAITVSSIDMALYFAEADWKDITIAFPLNILQLEDIKDLAEQVNLTILATEISTLKRMVQDVDVRIEVLIEIDCGYNRSGVWWEDHHKIQELIDTLAGTQHAFKGFYCHSGHTYKEQGANAVLAIFNDSIHKLRDLQLRFADSKPQISVGDTPSCSLAEIFDGIDSIHPGNFVFYDLTQAHIGSCDEKDISLALAAPVVSKNERQNQLIVHAGGVHLAKDVLIKDGLQIFGKIVSLTDDGWSLDKGNNYVTSISQEHGIVSASEELFSQVEVGDVIGILPVHSCMTADVMGRMQTFDGKQLDHLKKN